MSARRVTFTQRDGTTDIKGTPSEVALALQNAKGAVKSMAERGLLDLDAYGDAFLDRMESVDFHLTILLDDDGATFSSDIDTRDALPYLILNVEVVAV